MSRPVWYRSLYWRIAFGFITLLGVVLLAQIIIFLWLTDRIVGPSSRSPQQLAGNIATEISKDLQNDPRMSLDPYLHNRFGHIYQPFLVVLNDGRVGSNRLERLPPGFVRAAMPRGRRGGRGGPGDRRPDGDRRQGDGGRGGFDGRQSGQPSMQPSPSPAPAPRDPGAPVQPAGPGAAGGPGAGGGPGATLMPGTPRAPERPEFRLGDRPAEGEMRVGPRRAEVAPIMLNGAEAGAVLVPAESPPVFIAVWEVGPTLAWFALGLLGIGAAVTALAIFRPTHNRLRALEEAASALGQGRTDVRAVESGGDEVSSLARTFNQMAQDLEARAAALASSDRARRQLLADVSHELMTPLTAIRGYSETLGMGDLPLDAATRARYLDIIGEETQKLEALIGDLLDLARLEGGGGTLASKDVALSELFSRVIDRHGLTLRDRHITMTTAIEPEGLEVTGDPQRLEQALQNLAANALRHTPEGGRIDLKAVQEADGVHITIADSGKGIPPEHLPRVFDRFYKADPSRSAGASPSGSGLGLSIVQAIVERHGGRVSASNAPAGGAVFEIVLPGRASDRAA
jgi:signal transduction histidine kinase